MIEETSPSQNGGGVGWPFYRYKVGGGKGQGYIKRMGLGSLQMYKLTLGNVNSLHVILYVS